MWGPDDFPLDDAPWQLLIRARHVDEIDAVLAAAVVRHLAAVTPNGTAYALATVAQEALAASPREPASAEQRVAALDAAIEWEDRCGTPSPHPWPPRRREGAYQIVAPMTDQVIVQALELVRRGGSEQLRRLLGSALELLQITQV